MQSVFPYSINDEYFKIKCICRHIKLAAELAEMNWRVRWEDIMFGTMENDAKMRRQGSNISLTRVSILAHGIKNTPFSTVFN